VRFFRWPLRPHRPSGSLTVVDRHSRGQIRSAVILLVALATGLGAAGCTTAAASQTTAGPSATVTAEPTPTPATPSPDPTTPPPDPTTTPPAPPAPPPTARTQTTSADTGWEVVGKSVQGRSIRLKTLGHGPRKVLFVGGIHGDEPEGAYSTTQLPAAFADAGLADAVTLTILEDANPDGRAHHTRDNANGVDINRNFPATNFDTSDPEFGGSPLSQPESRALNNTIGRIGPDLVMVMHSWRGSRFINFDGPARAIAERFSADSGLPVEESGSIAPTPGSLGSYVGVDHGTAILTIELLHGSNSVSDWALIRTALIHAIAG